MLVFVTSQRVSSFYIQVFENKNRAFCWIFNVFWKGVKKKQKKQLVAIRPWSTDGKAVAKLVGEFVMSQEAEYETNMFDRKR